MKKHTLAMLISFVVIVAVATVVFSILSICNAFKPLEPIAEKPSTCTEPGNIAHYKDLRTGLLYSDSKGEKELTADEVFISALGHSCEHHNAELPTCTQDGKIEYWQCTRCSKYFTDQNGNNEIFNIQGESASGHKYNAVSYLGEWVWSIDYSAANLKYFCTVCNERQEVQAMISVKEIASNCEQIGLKTYKATVIINNIDYSDEISVEVPAIGHNFADEFIVDKAATCSEHGSKSKHCSRCDAKSEITEIPSIDHTIAIDIAVSPDCMHTGLTEGCHCSVCGATIVAQRILSKLEHDYSRITTDPTFTEQGYTHFTCNNCGFSYEGEFVDALLSYTLSEEDGHSYVVSGCNITNSMAVIVPETYKSLPISSIGGSAFADNTFILSITLPDNITCIRESAFSGCSSLVGANLSESLTIIGNSAFSGCSSLKNIYIPESVKTIGSSALSGCSSLVSITLPFVGESVKSSTDTYQYPFGYIFGTSSYTGGTATSQKYYTYAPGSGTYSSSTYYIPNSLESVIISSGNILSGAFYNCKLKKIAVPKNIRVIEKYAFDGCIALENFIIPTSVERIEYMAFDGCMALKSIVIPDNVAFLGEHAFSGCSALESVVISNNLTSLEHVFSSCKSLKSVTIPDKVSNINGAFFMCKSLENIYLPKSIKTMQDAFANIYNSDVDRKVYYKGTLADWCSLQFNSKADTPLIYQGHFYLINRLGEYEEVTNLAIPNTISKIGDYQFYGFSYLKNITIPNSITAIGNNAFCECEHLISINISGNVSIIGNEAFYLCSSLSKIEIGNSVKSIGKNAFVGCYVWAEVTFKTTNGWWVSTNSSATSGTNIPSSQLTNPSQAHTFLSASNYYADYYWKRS